VTNFRKLCDPDVRNDIERAMHRQSRSAREKLARRAWSYDRLTYAYRGTTWCVFCHSQWPCQEHDLGPRGHD
jgi:hypothetical protein